MARLGIDFGTTNTVAVLADRGHYPAVLHRAQTSAGDVVEEVFPSVIWYDKAHGEWRFGLEAERRARREPPSRDRFRVTSLKRLLRTFSDGQTVHLRESALPGNTSPDDIREGDATDAAASGVTIAVEELLVRFLGGLKQSILLSGMVPEGEDLECVISWPANSNGAQRHVTRRAFRAAGFSVVGSINEPTASAVEYADRIARGNRAMARKLRSTVAVFDLGGGTFDTSLVSIDGGDFHVVDTAGVEQLGGDDFDQVLLSLLLAPLKLREEELDPFLRAALLRHARMEKESISRDPERGLLELIPADYGIRGLRRPSRPVRVKVRTYYEALRPLVEQAIATMESVLNGAESRRLGIAPDRVDAIYLAGGASRLPLVPMLLRERFPRTKIVLSDKPFSSVAMGAAIVAAERVRISDIISRHFGVLRLRDSGKKEYFASIFRPGTRLPTTNAPPLEVEVLYNPQHNIGRLQYLECARLGQNDLPDGEVRRWSEVLFPYDPRIPPEAPLDPDDVAAAHHLGDTSVVEHYCCDSDGVITVKLDRRADGRGRTFEISRD